MTYRLSDEDREALYRAGDHHPDHCDCSAYVIEQAFAEDECCLALLDTFERVETIVAREVAAAERNADYWKRRVDEWREDAEAKEWERRARP